MEVAVLLEQLMLDDFFLGWVQFVQLLHEVFPLHLVELFPAYLDLFEWGQRLAQFGTLGEGIITGLLQLLSGQNDTVLSS